MNKKLLIIDDSKPIHRLVQAWLKEDPIEIHSAYDGKTGLATAAGLQPDLILLDIDMPHQSGFDVCRALKQNPATARISVVFLTAQSAAEEKVTGLDLGAEDYITKPFNPGELRARVRAALRRAGQVDPGAFQRVP